MKGKAMATEEKLREIVKKHLLIKGDSFNDQKLMETFLPMLREAASLPDPWNGLKTPPWSEVYEAFEKSLQEHVDEIRSHQERFMKAIREDEAKQPRYDGLEKDGTIRLEARQTAYLEGTFSGAHWCLSFFRGVYQSFGPRQGATLRRIPEENWVGLLEAVVKALDQLEMFNFAKDEARVLAADTILREAASQCIDPIKEEVKP